MRMIKDQSGEALEYCSVKRTTVINHMIPCNRWLQDEFSLRKYSSTIFNSVSPST